MRWIKRRHLSVFPEEAPALLDLLLDVAEAAVAVHGDLHGAVRGLPHQLPLPLLLGHERRVGDGDERVGDGDHRQQVVRRHHVRQLPVAERREVAGVRLAREIGAGKAGGQVRRPQLSGGGLPRRRPRVPRRQWEGHDATLK